MNHYYIIIIIIINIIIIIISSSSTSTKWGACHSQWPSSHGSVFHLQPLDPCCCQQSCFCSKSVLIVIPSLSSHVCNLLLPAPTAPTTAGTTFTRLIPHNLQGFLNLFTVLFMNSVMPWWSNIHNNLFLDKNNVRFSGFNTQGLLRYTSYIGTSVPIGVRAIFGQGGR